VVANGTGKKARINGVQVAGKTGTAEVSPGVPPHTWFVGFAPADHPKIAIAVFIANGGQHNVEGATGGDISAPIARQVMQAYLGEGG
jgi:penicillin-binding protein A